MPYRTGIGFDIHRLVLDRPLVLGGVTIEYDKGLLGHSDGDVIIHAICDAILGALSMGDIGERFPDDSADTKDIYSIKMLEEIIDAISPSFNIMNIDSNCICERPRLGIYRKEMVDQIAKACRIETSQVCVKFRTHEGIGEIGRSEAIAAQAVVMLKHR